MLPDKYRALVIQFEPEGDTGLLLAVGRELEADGNLEGAAAAYDRAYGIEPGNAEVRQARRRVLDQLAVVEHGLVFRYVPEGAFLMGSEAGEPDERPCHPVWLRPFWMTEVPVSWAAYCRLMDWEAPPAGFPQEWRTQSTTGFNRERFAVTNDNKIRRQYCEDHTTHARHSYREPDSQPPAEYEMKPMVAASWEQAVALGTRLSTPEFRYGLPSEAQWERAARGGLIGARYPWGDEPPSHENCDFDRFAQFSILGSRTFPPNGYGLYAMTGGVWEWTRDWYDSQRYPSAWQDPEGPEKGEERVVRGGCWADCAEVLRVSFRMSLDYSRMPNIGFRLCRSIPAERAP